MSQEQVFIQLIYQILKIYFIFILMIYVIQIYFF